jgi:hypothetical protein
VALDTYTNLKVEIAEWLNRQDLTAKIPTFITLLEAQAERVLLGMRDMETRSYATLTSQFLALPTDFLGIKGVQLNSSIPAPLEFVSVNQLDQIRRDYRGVTGQPVAYSIVGNELEFAPAPDASYEVEVVYWARLPRLVTTTQESNWLLSKHPDVYLFGSLLQAAPYLHNDERIAGWSSALSGILQSITVADERGRMSGQPLKMRIKPYGGYRTRTNRSY